MPMDLGYHYRMDYNLVKDNLDGIDIILYDISREIGQNPGEDYIIILGDSVGYSGPGPSDQSIGYYLQEPANQTTGVKATKVYNLSMPAMQTGDIYTMLLKLDRYRIPTDHLILNLTYAGFVARQPDPPAVFWLKEDLKGLDRVAYYHVLPQLAQNGYREKTNLAQVIHHYLVRNIAVFRYRLMIRKLCQNTFVSLVQGETASDAIGDAQVWTAKPDLPKLISQREYQMGFADAPFDFSTDNPQIYFLDKIFTHQKGKQTLVFLASTNPELMKEQVEKPGYQGNLHRLDNYFAEQPVQYINLQGKIDSSLFTDHVHLIPQGYRELSRILWQEYCKGSKD